MITLSRLPSHIPAKRCLPRKGCITSSRARARASARNRQTLEETPFVAVQAYELTAGEVPWLAHKLGFAKVRAVRHYANDFTERVDVPVKFLLLFNHRTERLAAPDGVLVIDTPSRGTIGRFGGVRQSMPELGGGRFRTARAISAFLTVPA